MRKLVLVMLAPIVFGACKKEPPQPVPVATVEAKTAVVAVGPNGTEQVDPKLAQDITQAANEVLDAPAQPIAAETAAAAVDPSVLVGTWNLKHTVSTIDYKARDPEDPLMPMTWTFTKDGTFTTHGGNELVGTFVLTKASLVISAVGVPIEYKVDKATATDLVVTSTIMPGMSNTTVLERVK
ncbi:MAG TPA: lipocalin family protein [Kofleriaceae bacterium]|jgi:hypothetical protein